MDGGFVKRETVGLRRAKDGLKRYQVDRQSAERVREDGAELTEGTQQLKPLQW